MFKEFKEFAIKGNVVDLAVGIIIGAAFGKIVSSVVNDMIMPVVGLALGGIDFANFFIQLSGDEVSTLAAAKEAGVPVVAYGQFMNIVIEFVIVAFAVFLLVKAINSAKKKEEEKPAEPAAPAEDIVLLREIRDSLQK